MIPAKHNCIQMFEKFDCFEIFVVTIFIGNPFPIFLAVIQIQHGCNRIDTQTVYVAFLYPEKCISDQEVFDLRPAVVVNLRSPIRVLSLSRVFMFINSRSVKVCKSVCILREMCRNPVKNNTYLVAMKIIDHIFEIFCCSVAGSRCIITGYLIAPGAIKRVLCNSHKFDMGIAHFLYISSQLMCQFAIIVKSRIILILCFMFLP